MHVENKHILPSDVTDIIWRVYMNFHEINIISQKFYPEHKLKGLYKNLEPYNTLMALGITWISCWNQGIMWLLNQQSFLYLF